MSALWLMSLLAASPVAFENVRVEVGDGTVLERTTVVLQGGRIASVGAERIPAGALRIDARGKVLTPGLIDARTQIGLAEVGLEKSANDERLRGMPISPAFRAADAFNPASVWIPVAREEGVTRAVVAPSGGILSGSGHWVDLTGNVGSAPDPTQPVALFGAVGSGAAEAALGSRGGLWMRLREVIADARFFARNRVAFERNQSRLLSLPLLQLEAVQPVLDGRVPLVLEAQRVSDILAALELARAERIRLVLAGGAESWKVADRIAAAGVPVILTPSAQMPISFDALAARDDLAALLDRARVRVVISAGGRDIRRLRQEAGIAVAYGLPRERALAAITLAPAEAYGRSDVGTIAPGKRADVVLWSGDPLELSTVAERIFIDGNEQPLDTRQRRLVERYRGTGGGAARAP